MTETDWSSFNASYLEKYGISFEDDLAKPEEEAQTEGAQSI